MADFLGYKNKRVVVSGCFSGMGEATTKRLLELGAEVHGLDFKETKLKLASFTQVDLRDPASIDAAAARITGKVDALFNCAGLPQTAGALNVMKVNYIGMRRLTEHLLQKMSAGSAIATISSTAGLRWSTRIPTVMGLIQADTFDKAVKWCEGNMDTVAEGYSFSKEAVIVWTMLNGAHLIKRGIRINCTLPGPTQTPMMNEFEAATPKSIIDAAAQPINRRSTPDEQAGPLIYLNSDAATYVNGVVFPTDGGFMGALTTGQIDMQAMMQGAA
jgi:NAD(P)-dependent dehydrogenase (short-subunit alcohol dehydrogenase family)